MIKKVIFPFSADPITKGHEDLIVRAKKISKEVIVVILRNRSKKYLLSLKERKRIVEISIERLKLQEVKVKIFEGLLADICLEEGTNIVIRGIRNKQDIEYELSLEEMHKNNWEDLEFIYLKGKREYQEISSSLVKANFLEGGDISKYVSLGVKKVLEERINKQVRIAVTGSMGVGKNYLCKSLKEYYLKRKVSILELDLDKCVGEIYSRINEKKYEILREKLRAYFGDFVIDKDPNILKQRLRDIVFLAEDTEEKLRFLQEELSIYIRYWLRIKSQGFEGIILINAPLIVEYNWLKWTNNEVILVNCLEEEQYERIKIRDKIKAKEMIKKRIELSGRSEEKIKKIKGILERDNFGYLSEFNNKGSKEKRNIFEEESFKRIVKRIDFLKKEIE